MHTQGDLLAVHDDQVRGSIEARMPPTWTSEWDGPLIRMATPAQGIAFAKDLENISVQELDSLIFRLHDFFSVVGEHRIVPRRFQGCSAIPRRCSKLRHLWDLSGPS